MTVLKCSICGGELEVNAELSVGVCQFCDSVITIPKEVDRKGNLYNRAVFLRQSNEFDKAVSAYEDILKEDNSDAEAHWGLLLSKFGIEYVKDFRTGEHLPTCHRTQTESILSDPSYTAVIEYADGEQKYIFENAAQKIHEIQLRIIEISRKEPPYDIFICYKETDEFGNRTEDSTIAQDLYYDLKQKGFKVFFARKTLENRLGSEYEPIIFGALNSAKVMIVIGTKAEYFTSPWVRNEWSRFMKLKANAPKTVIPAYRGISPYELPPELSVLQSQDMSKIGFIQDLTDGIRKIINGSTSKRDQVVKAQVVTTVSNSLERLVHNSNTYLRLKNFSLAEGVYNTIIKDYPEDYRGWWGLIICKTKNFTNVFPGEADVETWFKYVKQLAKPEEYTDLEKQYIEYLKKMADSDAQIDLNKVSEIANKYDYKIKDLERQISEIETHKVNRAKLQEEIALADASVISELEYNLESRIEGQKKYSRKMRFGTLLIIVGIVSVIIVAIKFSMGSAEMFELSVAILLGMGCISSLGMLTWYYAGKDLGDMLVKSRNDSQVVIDKIRMDLREENMKKQQHIDECNRDMNELDDFVVILKKHISLVENKIAECNNYINIGRDKIATLFFSERCKKIGVTQEFDIYIKELRDLAFKEPENLYKKESLRIEELLSMKN